MDRLGAAAGIELDEKIGRVGLYRVDGQEKFVGDLLIGEALGHALQHFILARADTDLLQGGFIGDETFTHRWWHGVLFSGEL